MAIIFVTVKNVVHFSQEINRYKTTVDFKGGRENNPKMFFLHTYYRQTGGIMNY